MKLRSSILWWVTAVFVTTLQSLACSPSTHDRRSDEDRVLENATTTFLAVHPEPTTRTSPGCPDGFYTCPVDGADFGYGVMYCSSDPTRARAQARCDNYCAKPCVDSSALH